MGFLKSIGTSIILIYTTILIVTFWPGLRPYGDFSEFKFVEPKALSGKLGINKRLDNVEKLFEGQALGPEAFAIYNGEIYSGLMTGEIVKITKDKKLETVFKISQQDEGTKLYKSGRPLALKFDKKGILYVTDFVFGIFEIDLKTEKAELIVDNKKPIEGKIAMANDLDIASNGDIYWSDTCAGFDFNGTFLPVVLINPSGRLLRYSPKTKRNEVLLDNLSVANGVALAKDESFVLVAETVAARIVKYHLKGSKVGQYEILIEGLPGSPDNINLDNKDGFLVSLPLYADEENWSYLHFLVKHPYIRKFLARLPYVLRLPFEYIHRFYPDYDPTPIVQSINMYFNNFMDSQMTVVLRLDKNGKITDAAYNTNKDLWGLSSAHIFGDDLWLGSYKAPHVTKIPVKQAFPSLAKSTLSYTE